MGSFNGLILPVRECFGVKGQMNALQNQILMSHDGRFIYIDRKTITNIKIDGISVMQISVIVSKRVYFFPHKRHKFASCNIEININNIITSFPPQFPIIPIMSIYL